VEVYSLWRSIRSSYSGKSERFWKGDKGEEMGKKWKMCEEVNAMITLTIGEIFKSSLTGKIYEVSRILDQMVVLQSLNGLNQLLTGKDNLSLFYEKVFSIELKKDE
jgi:hypothetical protein